MMFTGFYGVATGLGIFFIAWMIALLSIKGNSFDFDAQGKEGAFDKLLPIYLDIAKFILGLASASIVLLVGSSALHQTADYPARLRLRYFCWA